MFYVVVVVVVAAAATAFVCLSGSTKDYSIVCNTYEIRENITDS